MTRNGIEYDLPKSPYQVEKGNYIFYFSSELYKSKFTDADIAEYSIALQLTLEKKLDAPFAHINGLATILYYKKIEKRGFYIKEKRPFSGKEYEYNSIEDFNIAVMIIPNHYIDTDSKEGVLIGEEEKTAETDQSAESRID